MKILAVTGIRSEYDYLFPVLEELRKSKHLIKIVVTGAHLSHMHNETWRFIKKDKFIIADKIDKYPTPGLIFIVFFSISQKQFFYLNLTNFL